MTQLDAVLRPPLSDPAFRRDIVEGLSASPKATPPIWFYDRRGSELFEAITRLPEYYPTRAETAILTLQGTAIAEAIGVRRCVVEFGAGSLTKTPLLLRAIDPSAYVPVDISGDFLRDSAGILAEDFPGLPIVPVEADFTRPFTLPAAGCPKRRLGFFPGSTIGNFEPAAAVDLLRSMREALGDEAMLLIGMDRIKGPDVLVPAYDDAAGVTAEFNLNLLLRINRELGGDIPVGAFAHAARWNDNAARIEMHLVAKRAVAFDVAGHGFTIQAGESIHTESSHKYDGRTARLLLRAGGWEPVEEWHDREELFSLHLAKAAG
ncbi:MAG TPA: L-histidine N(alpha)-methyltransferase [Sphingobium sp.]|uniref:L-histidine N(alpha)-methyltransferase n=1 Tax=Sphingobium sp. TaxID=1912891 RepID=UPI002ED4EF43